VTCSSSSQQEPPAQELPPRTMAARVHQLLKARGETVAVAESLTGGLLAATLVEAPGASETFRGGLIVYATDLKATLGGVSSALLEERGPVDGEVAEQLAVGVRDRCGTEWGLATTGVAGPDPQDGKDPGTVWIALVGAGGPESRLLDLDGSRSEITQATVAAALEFLAASLDPESALTPRC
jgi:nicotinamide-nucleotide amidase